MSGLTSLFIDASADLHYLHGSHNPGLVVLSLLVSIFSATMALQTAQIARRTENQGYRQVAIGTGAIALGGGIWTMHFIGMLAFELPTHVHYGTGLTLLSLLPACAASWLALRLLANGHITWPQLVMSGTLVGLGVGAMHYSGMAALQTPALMRYEPVTFTLSIAVAVGLAILALWVRYGLRHTLLGPTQRFLASGVVMGLAIAGMHYTGMAAVRFIGEPREASPVLLLNSTWASLALSTFTVTVTVLVSALNGLIRSRELYRQVEESKSRLRAILNTAVDGIITINSRGLIQSVNSSVERLFGWTSKELIGRNINMLMPEPDQSRHDSYLRNYLGSGQPKIIGTGRDVTGLRKDGSLMPMRLAVGRVELADELLFVGFVTDITARHNLEASLRETAERAEQASAAKSALLANMSHEIRTPMNAIIGFTELLLRDELSAAQRSHLTTVRQSARSLLGLLNDILDTARLEKGGINLESIDFSLRELAQQVASSLRLGAQSKNLALTVDYPQDMAEYFRGDPLRIQQVLTNLLGNAIKFTERGSVRLVFSHEGEQVHIQIRDTGIGMTPAQARAIFAPFTQADASISRRFGGTGLGTTIASQLVELMGGDIQVESQPGEGSTFHVRLPLPAGVKPATQNESRRQELPPLNVLVADDLPQNLELVRLLLEQHGHRVTTASDGSNAVEKYMAEHFDLVLMDVHMPGTDGLQATRSIRQYEHSMARGATPIIALTASVMAEDRSAARGAGMTGFAVKPLDEAKLLAEIARALNIVPLSAEPAVTRETNAAELIDWLSGASLWGGAARLAKAMRSFLDELPARYPLPTDDQPGAKLMQFSLHGIRGGAANLALPSIAELASELEQAARAGDTERASAGLPRLRALLAAASQQLDESGLLDAEPAPTTPSNPALLGEAISELLSSLEHNEINPQALENVCAGLDIRHANALSAAVDAFEFEQAYALLKRVRNDSLTNGNRP
ncbi:MHYT domain-containing protein [Pseudomonas sp. LRF_L74]|uniref:MHYT domain-containing protein n=1 Tax=Pseudomonas sp. LRF_L74 TaxID=3369422 RepID=UPI003F5DB413